MIVPSRWEYVVVAKGSPAIPREPGPPAFFETKGAADAWITYMLRTGPGYVYTRWRLTGRHTVTPEDGR